MVLSCFHFIYSFNDRFFCHIFYIQQKTLVNTDFLSKQYNGICLYSDFQLQQRLFDLDLVFGSDVHRSFDDFSDSFSFGD